MSGYRFDESNVLITGATGGVGQGLCRYFCERGATVLALGRNRELLEQLGNELRENYMPVAVDVTDLAALRKAVGSATDSAGAVDYPVEQCRGCIGDSPGHPDPGSMAA